ncbi:MAG: hypothetical protein WAP51_02305 [Candidatus Sungiibacteriota bacterium]
MLATITAWNGRQRLAQRATAQPRMRMTTQTTWKPRTMFRMTWKNSALGIFASFQLKFKVPVFVLDYHNLS